MGGASFALRPFLRSHALASMLDPLVTSGTVFLVQSAVLLTVSKTEFASYSLAYSYVIMGQAVMSALFGGPLITLAGGQTDELKRALLGAAALRLQLAFAVALGAIGVGVAIAIGLPAMSAALAAIGMIGLSFRDAMRSVLASQMRLGAALVIALWFAGITIATLGAVWLFDGRVTAEGGLAALAIGAVATLARAIWRTLAVPVRLPPEAVGHLTRMAAWSVPGAVVIWLQNSFYLTLIAINLSLDAVAEVSAARMIAMPILITASGLLRLSQVRAAHKLATQGLDGAVRDVRLLARACLVAGAIAASACWLADSIVSPSYLPQAYPHLLPLAGAWLLFVSATVARGVYSSLYQAMGRYREIFILNLVVLPFVLGGVLIGPQVLGLTGAVLPMAAGELALLVMLAARARRGPTRKAGVGL